MSDENEMTDGQDPPSHDADRDESIEDDLFDHSPEDADEIVEDDIELSGEDEFIDEDDVNESFEESIEEEDTPDEEIVLGRDDVSEKPEALAAPRRAKASRPSAPAKQDATSPGLAVSIVKLAGVGFAVAALGVIGAASYAAWYVGQINKGLPDYQALAEYAPAVTTRVYAGDGSLVAEFARERRLFVPIEQMPEHVKQAFVSSEDKSFYEHTGIDVRGILRAQLSNIGNILRGRRLEGGFNDYTAGCKKLPVIERAEN